MVNGAMLYFFFFNDTATTEMYTLSLHDALPIANVKLVIDRGANCGGILGSRSLGEQAGCRRLRGQSTLRRRYQPNPHRPDRAGTLKKQPSGLSSSGPQCSPLNRSPSIPPYATWPYGPQFPRKLRMIPKGGSSESSQFRC